MSDSAVKSPVKVTEQDAREFYSAQESLLTKAIKNLDILDKKIGRARLRLKKMHETIKSKVKEKKQSDSENKVPANMVIIRISLKAKKEQANIKRLNMVRKAIAGKMSELTEVLEVFKQAAELKGIKL